LQRISRPDHLHAAFGWLPISPHQAAFLHTYSTVGQPGDCGRTATTFGTTCRVR
jgi:hypothetical protein